MGDKIVQELRQRHLGVLIHIVDIPNLPMPLTKWTTEQLNHFDLLLQYAYIHYLDVISWNNPMKAGDKT
ncbi:hypothetical protein CVD28_00595 [Bacillus sp. M6-12]|uniref:hypothetical protein n=1 Tax=Bacillus sp. M6-12 TaxID=2054166 RepID=UPI000C792864|nr:hypothetical protein [Bacillus sp. M6-12]PLS18933.1 hypothetical protein CVD28_00595 [Bacillus sp. M6-12]